MNGGYIVIYTHDNGGHWQATGMPYPESEDALRALRASMAAYPDFRYEMHMIDMRVYAALTTEMPVRESFY